MVQKIEHKWQRKNNRKFEEEKKKERENTLEQGDSEEARKEATARKIRGKQRR